ncbi:MAG: glycoside hydrolase family 16 protein [Hyphomonadaceae bacterium]|nr:glycoside hydrolase family 16 protein [Hyphomonadaceae bacterium]
MTGRGAVLRAVVSAVALAMAGLSMAQASEARPLDRRNLVLTFSDEFDTLNVADPRDRGTWTAGRWKTWYDNSSDPFNLHTRTLPGNGENQAYTDAVWPERVGGFPAPGHTIRQGVLRLRADRAPPSFRERIFGRAYTSAMISTWGMFAQRYGVFEARMKLPKGQGLWPAFWMLNAEGGNPPEIDVMEFLGHQPHSTWVVTHSREKGRHVTRHREVPHAIDITKDFHVFAVDWRPTTLTYYIDDVQVMQIPTPRDLHSPMYMILNLAVGGRWPGQPDAQTVFPAYLEVDYVRAWRRPGHDAPRPAAPAKARSAPKKAQ